jgi:hypothetical protein
MDAEELRVEAEARAGQAEVVLEQARALVAQAPFRERRWALRGLGEPVGPAPGDEQPGGRAVLHHVRTRLRLMSSRAVTVRWTSRC